MHWTRFGGCDRSGGGEVRAMALVLLADDDPVTRELVAFRLQMEGHRVIAVGDGSEALAAMRDQAPDIAWLDVHMPGRSGFDVCRVMRAVPDTAHVPVLMLPASVQADELD